MADEEEQPTAGPVRITNLETGETRTEPPYDSETVLRIIRTRPEYLKDVATTNQLIRKRAMQFAEEYGADVDPDQAVTNYLEYVANLRALEEQGAQPTPADERYQEYPEQILEGRELET